MDSGAHERSYQPSLLAADESRVLLDASHHLAVKPTPTKLQFNGLDETTAALTSISKPQLDLTEGFVNRSSLKAMPASLSVTGGRISPNMAPSLDLTGIDNSMVQPGRLNLENSIAQPGRINLEHSLEVTRPECLDVTRPDFTNLDMTKPGSLELTRADPSHLELTRGGHPNLELTRGGDIPQLELTKGGHLELTRGDHPQLELTRGDQPHLEMTTRDVSRFEMP